MSNPISRQMVIDEIEERKNANGYRNVAVISELNRLEGYIMRLPSEQSEQRWIPCSKKLPEDEYVLISKKPSPLSGSKWSVDIAIRMEDPRSRKIQWRDSGFGVIQDDKVLAWMPLPEPYEEDPCSGCGYLGESCVGEGCGKLTERKDGEADE